jgi:hypothetical protein
MKMNWIIVGAAALVPLLVGMVWYSKLLFANAWMKATGITEEDGKKANMPKMLGLTLLLGVLVAFALIPITVHQMGIFSVFAGDADQALMKDPNSDLAKYYNDFMLKYGTNFRTFKHGAFHGVLTGLFMALPIVGIASLFEMKSFKYVAIHVGYWIVCMALMGGIICQWI